MTVEQMKMAIMDVYHTRSWRRKVANMYDDQVIAIYRNFEQRGVLGKVLKRERPVPATYDCGPKEKCEQLSMFDFIK